MSYENLIYKVADGIGFLTINRPEVRNALTPETLDEILDALGRLERDDDVKVVIFTGAGEKSFAAGADINKLKDRTFWESLQPGMQGVNERIENFAKPMIAAVNGYALGGGCEIAMSCDIRIAAEHAKMGLPELNLGIIPGGGGTQRLVRLVGKGKAKELIFTGRIIDANEAEKIGLVNQVVPNNELMEAAKAMAKKMTEKGPVALYMAKKAINLGAESHLQTGLALEKIAQSLLMTTEDKREGTTAFLEKRKANFKGK
jgi:enoyl-CoA hydratase